MNSPHLIVEEVLTQISPEDEKLLFSLPYRIGLFVSFADTTGGWEAQDKEQQSLTGILQKFASDFYKTEFTQKVLMETLRGRSAWPTWSHTVEIVPVQVRAIMSTLKPLLTEEELTAFQGVLLDIALEVATAFQEASEDAQPEDLARRQPVVHGILSRMMGLPTKGDPLEHINISISEKHALRELMAAMDYTKQ